MMRVCFGHVGGLALVSVAALGGFGGGRLFAQTGVPVTSVPVWTDVVVAAPMMVAAAVAVVDPEAAAADPDPQAPPAPPAPPAQVAVISPVGGSFLGVQVVEVNAARAKELGLKEERGVEVTNVESESPAEKAGLKKGDVVLEYQGQPVEGTEQFIRLVRETPAGRQVKMSVHRGQSAQTLTATVGSRKGRMRPELFGPGGFPQRLEMWIPDMPRAYTGWRSQMFGVEAEGLDGQLAEYFGVKEGVLVRSVVKGSPAEKAGIRAGDVITMVEQKPVDSPRELSSAIRTQRGNRKTVAMTLMRDRKETTVTATFDDSGAQPSQTPQQQQQDGASADAPRRARSVKRAEQRF